MNRQERIYNLLNDSLTPTSLEVINQSHHHKHHAGDDGTGETHYDIIVVSDHFDSVNRVGRQRMVNKLLKTEFDSGLHALSMSLYAPGEKE